MKDRPNIIKEILDRYGLNKSQLAKVLEVDDVRIGRYEKDFGPADYRFLSKLLEKFPSLRAYWLLTGKGPMEWGGADEEVKFLCEKVLGDPEIKKTLYHFLKWQSRDKNNGL